jgi:hypothetical protein
MLQPTTGSIICSACNAAYESLSKLRDHQRVSHRGAGIVERPITEGVSVQAENPEILAY